MNAIEFVGYFNLIKPSFEEVVKSTSSTSPDIADNVFTWYDLQVTSIQSPNDGVISLIDNTNICDLPFSVFQFSSIRWDSNKVKIGSIEEKGDLYFDRTSAGIIFEEMYEDMYDASSYFIDQRSFLAFFLKFLELYFAKVYQRNPILTYTKKIPLDIPEIKRFAPFNDLLSEIGHSFEEL